jgi:4-amino-4-deoxy-L-arabinose transferase-like glycosyltransferase
MNAGNVVRRNDLSIIKQLDHFTFPAILLLSFLLRLAGISQRPLWYDEAFSILFSQHSIQEMLYGTLAPSSNGSADVHPLGYYTFLHFWMKLFGDSLIAVRLPSIIFGMGGVILAYIIIKNLLGRTLGTWASLLVAVSPFQIHYSQEIRMYSLMLFLLLLATLVFWKGITQDRPIWWILFACLSALAQYTHNLSGIFLFTLASTALVFRSARKKIWYIVPAGVGALLLYFPWLLSLPSQLTKVKQNYWTTTPEFSRLLTTLLSFTTNLPVPQSWLPLALFITLVTLFIATFQTVKQFQRRDDTLEPGLWLAYMAFAPIALMFLISMFLSVYIERALLYSGVMYLGWVAWSLKGSGLIRGVQWFTLFFLFIGMGLGYYQHLAYRGFPYGPYSEMISAIKSRLEDQDIVLHSNKLTLLPSVYYDRSLPQEYLDDPAESGSDTLAPATQRVLGLMAIPSIDSMESPGNKIWFVIFKRAIEEYQNGGYSNHPQLTWLNGHYSLLRIETWGDILVYVYTR